jgi:hypothetical protein
MTAFGSAIGLSLVSPYHGPSPIIFYVVLALWFTWITVSSFVAGGYVAGRMRRPIDGATTHEVHVRDGVHGLVVWAVAVAIGTSLATLSLSSAVKGGADFAKSGASSMSSGVASVADPIDHSVDTLLRTNESASAGKSALAGNSRTTDTSRQEISRILVSSAANGALSSDDRAYLARVVAARTSLSQADAEKRVDVLSEQMKSSADKLRAATETARKAGILLAFLTAASMVLGAAAAWWGAGMGGRHRDEKFDASHLTRW